MILSPESPKRPDSGILSPRFCLFRPKKVPDGDRDCCFNIFLFVIIIRLITLLFREPVEKQITNKDKIHLKIINVIMGLINGYAAIVLLMFVLSPVVEIDYERPVTAMVAKTSHPVFAVSF